MESRGLVFEIFYQSLAELLQIQRWYKYKDFKDFTNIGRNIKKSFLVLLIPSFYSSAPKHGLGNLCWKNLWPGIQLLHSYMLSSLFHLSFISRDLSLVTSWFPWSLINNPCKEWRSTANFHVQYEGNKMTIQWNDQWNSNQGALTVWVCQLRAKLHSQQSHEEPSSSNVARRGISQHVDVDQIPCRLPPRKWTGFLWNCVSVWECFFGNSPVSRFKSFSELWAVGIGPFAC